jgi:hypothetical protein
MSLSPGGVNALLAKPEPVAFVLWHRPKRGTKWVKMLTAATRAECVNAVNGSGEFWIAEIRAEALANTLFPDADTVECPSPASATPEPSERNASRSA